MERKELIENIKGVEITYNYEESYSNLYNACIDYMNETQDWSIEYLFEDFIDYELAEERAKWELENGGLIRLYYFLGNANLNNDVFRINGYGNLEDITKDDLDYLKEQVIEQLEEEKGEE